MRKAVGSAAILLVIASLFGVSAATAQRRVEAGVDDERPVRAEEADAWARAVAGHHARRTSDRSGHRRTSVGAAPTRTSDFPTRDDRLRW